MWMMLQWVRVRVVLRRELKMESQNSWRSQHYTSVHSYATDASVTCMTVSMCLLFLILTCLCCIYRNVLRNYVGATSTWKLLYSACLFVCVCVCVCVCVFPIPFPISSSFGFTKWCQSSSNVLIVILDTNICLHNVWVSVVAKIKIWIVVFHSVTILLHK